MLFRLDFVSTEKINHLQNGSYLVMEEHCGNTIYGRL